MRYDDHTKARGHKERVSVGRRFYSGLDAEEPGGTPPVLNDKLLPKFTREAIRKTSCCVVR